MPGVSSFTFGSYSVDAARSTVSFTYHVEFKYGITKRFTDRLYFQQVPADAWNKIPKAILDPTLQSLLLILGLNYWCTFRTHNIRIAEFTLTRAQADFWNTLYVNGLAEFFYFMKIDWLDLIAFPFDDSAIAPEPARFPRPTRALLLNGAGKDSILSAELLKVADAPFDFFSFAPTPAHSRIAKLVGATMITVTRKHDPFLDIATEIFMVSRAYPSVSTFTFIATLLAELLGYNSIVFSNEQSADIGNLVYRGLPVNHQWCKSSAAEKLINDYITRFITPDISTSSLLRQWSEIEIVRRFVQYPQYLPYVTSCNSYFWLPRGVQLLQRRGYWCTRCPKCVFLFACFAAFLPKKELVSMFGADLFTHKRLLPLFRQILGIEGFKPLDCVGEPEEIILAMQYARRRGEYLNEPAMQLFEAHFPASYDFVAIEQKIVTQAL